MILMVFNRAAVQHIQSLSNFYSDSKDYSHWVGAIFTFFSDWALPANINN